MAHRIPPAGSLQNLCQNLPARIPLFPLRDALLLPGGDLPLNIFEPRYVAMLQWAISTDRLIGMIQPNSKQGELYETGCAGRITQYQEMDDGRCLITLRGVSRFKLNGIPQLTSENYLLANIDWTDFTTDCTATVAPSPHLCRTELKELLDPFLVRENLSVDWEQAACIPDVKLYTLLAMVIPFSASEKQALLEATDVAARCELLLQMLKIASADKTTSTNRVLQ